MSQRRVFLIGIGGSTGSGKSTLASALAKELASPVKVFSADHFFDIAKVRRAGTWESPATIAWDDLHEELECVVKTLAEAERLPAELVVGRRFTRGPLELIPSGHGGKPLGSDPVVVFIEGFLLLHDKKICDMLAAALWIETDCDTSCQRRWNREGRRKNLDEYAIMFRKEIWQYYERFRPEQLANVPTALRLDGALEPPHLVADATPHCRGALGSGVCASDLVCVANPSAPESSAVSARRRVILIGIGGSSASGKTTLASSLAKELASPVKVFSADHYLDLKRVRRAGTWETPAGIAWDDLRLALERVTETLAQATCLPQHLVVGEQFSRGPLDLIPRGQGAKPLDSDTVVVLVEGFLLFHDKKTCDMLDVAIWVETECDICAIRRWKREGQRGDSGAYGDRFRQEVWHHYELYRGEQLANVPNVLQLDGALEPSYLVKEAERHCRSAIDAVVDEAALISKTVPGLPSGILAELKDTATKLCAPGKGFLAADESAGPWLRAGHVDAKKIPDTIENRAAYRSMCFATPGLSDHISGVILHWETLFQADGSGKPLVDIVKENGMIPGIKLDKAYNEKGMWGTAHGPLGHPEVSTRGLDDLQERAARAHAQGARFAKWRNVLQLDPELGLPSDVAIADTVHTLARYASICQSERLVPILEPEIVTNGFHDIGYCARVTEKVLSAQFAALQLHHVYLPGTVLRPNMVKNGIQGPRVDHEMVAHLTVSTLLRTVPAAVPGIFFLSGDTAPDENNEETATANLNEMNKLYAGRLPWHLSFSFGRALQKTCIVTWMGDASNKDAAQKALKARAHANSDAVHGKYIRGTCPSVGFDLSALI